MTDNTFLRELDVLPPEDQEIILLDEQWEASHKRMFWSLAVALPFCVLFFWGVYSVGIEIGRQAGIFGR
jgi:hypothetical protein